MNDFLHEVTNALALHGDSLESTPENVLLDDIRHLAERLKRFEPDADPEAVKSVCVTLASTCAAYWSKQ